ncbi:hypothetical protein GCM10022227_46780 [Streptomyces sedi]
MSGGRPTSAEGACATAVHHAPGARPVSHGERAIDAPGGPCLHRTMPGARTLTRRRCVDLLRVAAAMCPVCR